MDQGETSNNEYYDTLSSEEGHILEKRALTRNHYAKFDTISRALHLDSGNGGRVLEVGVGYGAHGNAVVASNAEYVGIDLSQGLLTTAVKRFASLQEGILVAADATRMPFAGGAFDGVFCVATLHHLPEPGLGVAEMIRVLKPGGRFCFLEPTRFYPTTLIQYARHPDIEVSVMKMTARNLRRWCLESGAKEVNYTNCIYTPNTPSSLVPFFDAVDRIASGLPLIRRMSVMQYVHGVK
jgi:ubiquinone/menaquinone biosynthesis C-methylase UbiE